MRIRWTTPALRQISSIGTYLAGFSPRAADRVLRRIEAAVSALRDQPEMGRPLRAGVRELVIGRTNYLVVYRVAHREVVILAVFHGGQRRPTESREV